MDRILNSKFSHYFIWLAVWVSFKTTAKPSVPLWVWIALPFSDTLLYLQRRYDLNPRFLIGGIYSALSVTHKLCVIFVLSSYLDTFVL